MIGKIPRISSPLVDEPDRAVLNSAGGPVDPTKNVLDLVRAESRYQDAMRVGLETLLDEKFNGLKELVKAMSDGMTAYQNAQIGAETRRIDQLAQTRQEFQNTIRDMLAESVRTTSTLVSTQLVQIQATFDTRVSKLEAGAFTQAGKQSVADPAISEAITRMTLGLTRVKADSDESLAKMAAVNTEQITKLTAVIGAMGQTGAKTSGVDFGRTQVIGWIVAAIVAAGAASTFISFILRGIGH